MSTQRKIRLKIAVIGDPKVGKTSFINNVCMKPFNSTITETQGYKVTLHRMTSINKQYEIQLWDCGTQHLQSNKFIRSAFFKKCSAAFLIFDLSKPEQQWKNSVEEWLEEAYQFDCFLIYAIGTKRDYNKSKNCLNTTADLTESLIEPMQIQVIEETNNNQFFTQYQIQHFYQNATDKISYEMKSIFSKIQNDQYKRARGSLAIPKRLDNSILEGSQKRSVLMKNTNTVISIKQQQFQDLD